MKRHLSLFAFITGLFASSAMYGQVDSSMQDSYSNMSLKDLLNVKIVSASKSSELLFDAPLSASVVTKEDIRKAGCTSIMEALRLVPGVIVREQSNGNYDIHLRGMDNVPPYASFDLTSNTTTLVMIDNRAIYSYLRGGTFWETLPIDINDVEKIEVVRGPAAALYGPNAVNGVINILTRHTSKQGFYAVANAQKGSAHTSIANTSVGYQLDKWKFIVSGNYQGRDRYQTSYFEYNRNQWLDHPDYFLGFNGDTIRNMAEHYPDPGQSMKKYAGNVFVDYDANDNVKFRFSSGVQHSTVQRVSTENEITPLSTACSRSQYADIRANIKSLSAQVSFNKGTQLTEVTPGNKYDFSIVDANIEYNYTKGRFSLKPGFAYKSAIYDDTKYSDTLNKKGIFNAKGEIDTYVASLRSEYKLFDNKLRLVAGIAGNQFNYPDTSYLSYELAATYKLNKKHLFRFVYSQAPRSSNIFDTYVNQTIAFYPIGYKKFNQRVLQGNKNIGLLTAGMFETGYRYMIASSLSIDVELFHIHGKNYNTLVSMLPVKELRGTDTIMVTAVRSTNLPLELLQNGVTASIWWKFKKLQLKPFITVQKTNAENYYPSNSISEPSIYAGMGSTQTLESTPTVYGGMSVNYEPLSFININVNSYYYSEQTYGHLTYLIFNDGVRGIDHIPSKLIVNTSISYQPCKGLHIFGSGKNILNNKSREFFRTDEVPATFFAGMNYEF
jgi:iron complex outermembrane receptor protein